MRLGCIVRVCRDQTRFLIWLYSITTLSRFDVTIWCGVCIVSCSRWCVQDLPMAFSWWHPLQHLQYSIAKDMIFLFTHAESTRTIRTAPNVPLIIVVWYDAFFFHCSFGCLSGYKSTTMCSRTWPAICHMRWWLEWLGWVRTNQSENHIFVTDIPRCLPHYSSDI